MTTEPIRDRRQLDKLVDYWRKRGNIRNCALIVLGACIALRISDLISLRWTDVYDDERGRFRSHITITEKKTGKRKSIALSDHALKILGLLIEKRRSEYIFDNNRRDPKPISRVQAWRIIKAAVTAVRMAGVIAANSLRKTFGYHAWTSGASPVVIMDIYNHSSYETTRRYLGVAQDDRDKVYLGLKLFQADIRTAT